jgi:hypothetical protein
VITSSTDASGAFSMRVTNGVTDTTIADTVLTIFVTGHATVGRVADSLVMRVPVPVRMSRDLVTPVVTQVALRAGY